MDEPRFARIWRRRAFGLNRPATKGSAGRAGSTPDGLGGLLDMAKALAVKLKVKLKGRRARLRLVHPEREPAPAPPPAGSSTSVRLDARGLQRLLECEMWRGAADAKQPEHDPTEVERVRRSG